MTRPRWYALAFLTAALVGSVALVGKSASDGQAALAVCWALVSCAWAAQILLELLWPWVQVGMRADRTSSNP